MLGFESKVYPTGSRINTQSLACGVILKAVTLSGEGACLVEVALQGWVFKGSAQFWLCPALCVKTSTSHSCCAGQGHSAVPSSS